MLFGEKILEYWDDILKDLETLIAIPSVCSDAEGEFPYGKNSALAVDTAMAMAEKYGLTAKNVGYHACHAEIGEGEEIAAVMAHLDVVPEGEGWNTDPYTMVIDGNIAYGRGVSDDKGPLIVALHCLRALKDNNVIGKRKLRVIMGSAEEIGMKDIPKYYESEPMPTMGFTPDSSYGVCNCEKGILQFTVKSSEKSEVIKSFIAGTVKNAVPYKAEAEIICNDDDFNKILEISNTNGGEYEIKRTDFGAFILSKGVASHSAKADLGKNAASYLFDLLYKVFGAKLGNFAECIVNKIGLDIYGSNIGVACEDEPSGKLTFNLGLVKICNNICEFAVDIRYPATFSGDELVDKINNGLAEYKLKIDNKDIQLPLYLPADTPLVKILSSAYEDVTGNKCELYSMGGGTYARQMGGKGVAFGADFKGFDNQIHNCNERINLDDFKVHAKICLEAMYRMYVQ